MEGRRQCSCRCSSRRQQRADCQRSQCQRCAHQLQQHCLPMPQSKIQPTRSCNSSPMAAHGHAKTSWLHPAVWRVSGGVVPLDNVLSRPMMAAGGVGAPILQSVAGSGGGVGGGALACTPARKAIHQAPSVTQCDSGYTYVSDSLAELRLGFTVGRSEVALPGFATVA
jgi:hypothetical protein